MTLRNVGSVKADAEPLIDILRSIRGVKVALILREMNLVLFVVAFVPKMNRLMFSKVARAFEGGGHKAAAGFTF